MVPLPRIYVNNVGMMYARPLCSKKRKMAIIVHPALRHQTLSSPQVHNFPNERQKPLGVCLRITPPAPRTVLQLTHHRCLGSNQEQHPRYQRRGLLPLLRCCLSCSPFLGLRGWLWKILFSSSESSGCTSLSCLPRLCPFAGCVVD